MVLPGLCFPFYILYSRDSDLVIGTALSEEPLGWHSSLCWPGHLYQEGWSGETFHSRDLFCQIESIECLYSFGLKVHVCWPEMIGWGNKCSREKRDADEERSVLIFVLNLCCMSSPSAFGFKSDVLLTWKKKS